jgi:hypothetical protein
MAQSSSVRLLLTGVVKSTMRLRHAGDASRQLQILTHRNSIAESITAAADGSENGRATMTLWHSVPTANLVRTASSRHDIHRRRISLLRPTEPETK